MSLLRPEVRRQVEAAITQEILARYRETSDVSNEALIVGDYCFRWESAPTLPTFYMFVDLRSVASERNVMMDPDVLQLLEILPAAMRARGDLGARVIHRLQRMAAWVPNSNTLLPLCWPRAAHKMSRRVKPILGKARRRLWGDSPFTTGSWPKHAVLYLRNDKWRSRFHCVLDNPDLFDREIFDRDAVRKCWREFRDGDQSLSADVEKLVQLGLTSQLLQSGWTRFAVAMK